LVANTSLKTPTAVAEFIIGGLSDFESKVNFLFEQVFSLTTKLIREEEGTLNNYSYNIKLSSQRKVHQSELKLNSIEDSIKTLPKRRIEKQLNKLDIYEAKIIATDPIRILKKGFSITKINGKSIQNILNPETGDLIETTSKNGIFESIVK
jgi:exodeoxyribonuclease VII large subunit